MTLRPFHLTFGIDPGTSGAIAVIHDNKPVALYDMPLMARKAGGDMVDGRGLATLLRKHRVDTHGAAVLVALEQVAAMPGQGVSSMFRFGQADGIIRGVVAAMRMPLVTVPPLRWKGTFGLRGSKASPIEKDATRALAIERFPHLRDLLKRKKDVGRADALFIGLHAYGMNGGQP